MGVWCRTMAFFLWFATARTYQPILVKCMGIFVVLWSQKVRLSQLYRSIHPSLALQSSVGFSILSHRSFSATALSKFLTVISSLTSFCMSSVAFHVSFVDYLFYPFFPWKWLVKRVSSNLYFVDLDPIANISVSGNNWLQHGELLSLTVNCKGSARIQACYLFREGLY